MGSLSQAKTLGGVGSILALLGLVPYAGPVIAIVGLILTLVAVKYISDIVGDKAIFNNMIISVVLAIAGMIVAALVVIGSVFRFIGMGNIYASIVQSQPITPGMFQPSDMIGMIGGILLGLVALWIFFLVSAVFLRRSYNSVGSKLKVHTFETGTLIYLIGAGLAIVLVGFILVFVAQVLFIVAFFSLPEQPEAAPTPQVPTAPIAP